MSVLGTKTKSMQRAKNFKLADCGWNADLQRAYDRMRLSVVHAVKRTYRNYKWTECLLWDASKYAWSYSITQVAPEEVMKPWVEQHHQLLVTRSGVFPNEMANRDRCL